MNESQTQLPGTQEPEALERTFRQLTRDEEIETFTQEMLARHAQEPDNLLFAAWYARLTYVGDAVGEAVHKRVIAWQWAIPLALLNAFLFWWLSDESYMFKLPGDTYGYIPWLVVYWMPISTIVILIYWSIAGGSRSPRTWMSMVGLGALSLFVCWAYQQMVPRVAIQQYLNLTAIHLPITALAGIGIVALNGRKDVANRFALLLKMLETLILAGIFVLVGGVFVGITTGLFSVLEVDLPTWVTRVLVAGGLGLIPILAIAILYDPTHLPREQSFDEGLSKVITLLLRLVLPLSLLVLAIYLAFIPFNYQAPLTSRDVLIIYNLMLFAVMILLLGVTPVQTSEMSAAQERWLRWGILGVAGLALLVGLYALFAISYRTWHGALTPNRLAFIGWNVINISLLLYLLIGQWQVGTGDRWLPALKRVFARGAVLYSLWALFVILSTPWLFGQPSDPAFADLPLSIQSAIYGEEYPTLLKCDSPHIYLLERGKKRWIKDIPTFEDQGYRWEDVRFASCEDLRRIPDGPPVPPDAGPPPVPYSPYGPVPTPTLTPTPISDG